MMRFFKGDPNAYILLFRNGRIVREGAGLNFWYMPMVSTIASVPTVSTDAPFIFTETTSDFQEVAVQGTLTYNITQPAALARLLDFSINPGNGHYLAEDPEKVVNRVVTTVQALTRTHIATFSLREALRAARPIATGVMKDIGEETDLERLGIEVDSIHITSMKARPEMQKALEAEYREQLQREADQAIYARRAAAVEEERTIKARELGTEIELENRRQQLVDTQVRNSLATAEAEAKAEEMKLGPYAKIAPQALIGLALKAWAEGGGNIGNLSISPDILAGLVGWLNRADAGTKTG